MDDAAQEALRRDGDGYFTRNRAGIGTIADPAFDALLTINASFPITSLLEVGCTTGFRLEKARLAFGARCVGLEASPAAVEEGRRAYPSIELEAGLAPADLSRWQGEHFDCIVLGYFTYLLPRTELFTLAAAIDGLLADNGHIVVMDFLHPSPMSSPYAHRSELTTFKSDPSAPWLWSPTYSLVGREVYAVADDPAANRDPRGWSTIDVLRKLPIDIAYPHANTLPSVHATPAAP
jgi:cyclopropane fatty-acyl-phospholipid synthase-like methyltransferase